MRNGLRYHTYTIDDWTHRQAQIASGTVVGYVWQMRFRVECNRLIARISASHVTLSTVNTQILEMYTNVLSVHIHNSRKSVNTYVVNESNHLLFIVQFFIGTDMWQRQPNDFLYGWSRF